MVGISKLKKDKDDQETLIGQAGRARNQGFARAEETYAPVREQYKPYMDFGKTQLSAVEQLFGDPSSVKGLPGYKFRFQEGQQAIESGAAGKGKLFSGNTLRELVSFGQEFATTEYDKELGRRMAGVNVGVAATQGYDAASVNLADIQAGRGQAEARQFEDKSKWVAGHEQFGREMFSGWFGGSGPFGQLTAKGCWVAEELYGKQSEKTLTVRKFVNYLVNKSDPSLLGQFARQYLEHGERWAKEVKTNAPQRATAYLLWDELYDMITIGRPDVGSLDVFTARLVDFNSASGVANGQVL